MHVARFKHLAALAVSAAVIGSLAACGPDAGANGPTSPAANPSVSTPAGSPSAQALPPIMADPGDADGNKYTVPMNNTLVFTGLMGVSPTVWQGKAEKEGVVEFVPGKEGADGTFNPGWKPVAPGTTKVTMVANGGTTYTFTITVVPAE